MRRGLLALFVLPSAAQTLLAPAAVPAIFAEAPPDSPAASIACQVSPIRPALTFGLRLQAGYSFHFPLGLYTGSGHVLTVLTAIASDGAAAPAYLLDRLHLPAAAAPTGSGEASGSYFLGEGHYRVEWLLFDDAGRSCRKHWDIDAQLGRYGRDIKLAMPPNSVTDLALRSAVRPPAATAATRRLTVLLDAAPLPIPRESHAGDGYAPAGRGGGRGAGGGRGPSLFPSSRPEDRMPPPVHPDEPPPSQILKTTDQVLLLGALSALLEQLPAADVRVVVFNLEQQKEIFRAEHFQMDWLSDVGVALNQLQVATIDIHTLQNRTGHLDLLAGLINGELRAETRSDIVVFLGPRERFQQGLPDGLLQPRRGPAPRFFFLACQLPSPRRETETPSSPGGRGLRRPSDVDMSVPLRQPPDSVSLAVAKLKGKTIAIESPQQFAKAIQSIGR